MDKYIVFNMNIINLPNDLQNKIMEKTNMHCHTCYKKFSNINSLLECKRIKNNLFCSIKCFNHI